MSARIAVGDVPSTTEPPTTAVSSIAARSLHPIPTGPARGHRQLPLPLRGTGLLDRRWTLLDDVSGRAQRLDDPAGGHDVAQRLGQHLAGQLRSLCDVADTTLRPDQLDDVTVGECRARTLARLGGHPAVDA